VTSGIATGRAEWTGECGPEYPDGDVPRVGVVGASAAKTGITELGGSLRATVLGARGVTDPGAIRWFGGSGLELGRGRSLDVAAIPIGRHSLTIALVGSPVRVAPAQVHVERTADDRVLLLVGDLHPRSEPCEPDEPHDETRRHHGDHTHDREEN
jgi:hypothetical protein